MIRPLPEPLRAGFLPIGKSGENPLEVIERIDALHAEFRAQRDAGRILPNTVEAVRVELTYHSNAIEGSTLSLRETALVIEGHAPTSGRTLREVYEARNHDRAIRMIESWAESREFHAPITERDLLDVHAQVLADIDARNAGSFRTGRVLIKGTRFIPPGAHRFGELIPALLSLAGVPGGHPVLQAAELHYNIVAVHPFGDGNGRTARLMMNYFLLRRGYPHVIIEIGDRAEYLAALEEANDGRTERFGTLVAACVERSIRRLVGDP